MKSKIEKKIEKGQKLNRQEEALKRNADEGNLGDPYETPVRIAEAQLGEYKEYDKLDADGNQVRDYTGMAIMNPAVEFSEGTYNLVGMNNGDIQVGINALDGSISAGNGQVQIDYNGIALYRYPNPGHVGGGGSSSIRWYSGYPALPGTINFSEEVSYGTFGGSTVSFKGGSYGISWTTFDSNPLNIKMSIDPPRMLSISKGAYIPSIQFSPLDPGPTHNGLVNLSTIPPSSSVGILDWNVDRDTLNLYQTGTTLQLGQEVHFYVINQTGSTIANGTAVMFAGSLGASGILKAAPAVADGTYPAIYMMGIATQEILNGEKGKVTFFGEVHGINTSAYSDGDILYLDPATPGGLTKTQPSAPNLKYAMAAVVNAGNNGTIFVRAIYSQALSELNDVTISSPSTDQVLKYDGTKWVNGSGGGSSVVPDTGYMLQASTECWTKTDGSFTNVAIGTGTISNVGGAASHPGIIKLSSVATNNTGGFFGLSQTDCIVLGGVEEWQMIIRPTVNSSNVTGLLGFMDSQSASVTPTNGLCLKLTGNGTTLDLAFLSRVAGAGSATNFTTLSNNTWYRIKMTNGGTGAVNVYVYNMSGTQLATYNFTGSVPTAQMGFGIKMYRTNNVATDLIDIDRIDLYSTGKYTR